MSDQPDLPAGNFSAWLAEIDDAIRGGRGADVPCGGCTACCTSSQFVHIEPDETDTLAHIPAELLFPAPRLPPGHLLLGYDERGHCPMLVDNKCSIYQHRPQTCRTYDCRVFPAAGVGNELDGDKDLIARRARRWQFGFATESDRIKQESVQAAAAFLQQHRGLFPKGDAPANATQLAVIAIQIHDTFLRADDAGHVTVVDPGPEAVRAAVVRARTQKG